MFVDLEPIEFVRRREAGERWQLLDVREPWEIAIAHIGGTIDIPVKEVAARIDELDKESPIAVVCHSGGRSAQIAGYLVQRGFARVANIAGGIDAWSRTVDRSIPRY